MFKYKTIGEKDENTTELRGSAGALNMRQFYLRAYHLIVLWTFTVSLLLDILSKRYMYVFFRTNVANFHTPKSDE